MAKKKKSLNIDEPLLYPDHPRPKSRRDFIRQGLITGGGLLMSGGVFSLFSNPRTAYAALSDDIQNLAKKSGCPVGGSGTQMIPVICFDLAGGANIAGSNVLVGRQGQLDLLSADGYSRLGLPSGMLPSDASMVSTEMGLAFHSQSAMLAGIRDKGATAMTNVNGVVIPARSDNDTGNNPHNPMYAFAHAGVAGSVVPLIGSRSSDSGGNSMAPANLIEAKLRPTKVDRPSDAKGLLDTSGLTAILNDRSDVTAVMESIARLSHKKLGRVHTNNILSRDTVVKDLIRCGYLSAADLTDRLAGESLDVFDDPHIAQVGGGGIFEGLLDNSRQGREFQKTAAIMKMVVGGYAGAGTITMGGYDYHTGDRATGERRDFLAGQCIGACLDYARRLGTPLMIYVFSDGSVSSNGRIDGTVDGGDKGEWTSDNSGTAASFILVFDPTAQPTVKTNQIGFFSSAGSVVTTSSPAANNPNLLVNTVLLNYLAINGQEGRFDTIFDTLGISHGLGAYSNLIAFNKVSPVPTT